MEQNMQVFAKKFLKMIRMACPMLRKGVSKGKLLANFNMMLKRGKIAGKSAVHSLMFHHHGGAGAVSPDRQFAFPVPLDEYEFSGSINPPSSSFRFPFRLNKHKHSCAASPDLAGRVRQLRITDSPFPLTEIAEEDSQVDEAAEEFINRFYRELRRQNGTPCLDYSF